MTRPSPKPAKLPSGLSALTLFWVAKQHTDSADEIAADLRQMRRAVIQIPIVYDYQDRIAWHRHAARKLRKMAREVALARAIATRAEQSRRKR